MVAFSGVNPLRVGLARFLCSNAIVGADGAVLSWWNPAHEGYAYPEAAGLLLSALAQHVPDSGATRARVASWLWSSRGPHGGIGRAGREYTFDTAIALRACVSHALVEEGAERERWLARAGELRAAILPALSEPRPFLETEVGRGDHWSLATGAHLLKGAVALRALAHARGAWETAERRACERLLESSIGLESDGRWRTHASSTRCYLHAQAYALEGLCALVEEWPAVRALLERGVARLARLQRPSGGIPAWDDAESAPERADATAQAARLWWLVDPSTYAGEIARARSFLARLQTSLGGMPYETGSRDENSWCSAFALQAEAWSERGSGSMEELF